MIERKKPKFYRRQWHIKNRFGRKKKLKWVKGKGMDNKIRLKFKGYAKRVEIGWGNAKKDFKKINGYVQNYVENFSQLEKLQKGQGIVIASVGRKKKIEMIKKANEKGLVILNKYLEKK